MRCSECKGFITPPRRGALAVTCSDKCRKARSRRLKPTNKKTARGATLTNSEDDERGARGATGGTEGTADA